jgi:hypothetical protein
MQTLRLQWDTQSVIGCGGTTVLVTDCHQRPELGKSLSADTAVPSDAAPIQDPAETGSAGQPIHVPYAPDLRARPNLSTNIHTHVAPKPMVMRDYQLLAEACQRAGKARMEGHAYFARECAALPRPPLFQRPPSNTFPPAILHYPEPKQGELLALNRETLPHAIKQFKKYLSRGSLCCGTLVPPAPQ